MSAPENLGALLLPWLKANAEEMAAELRDAGWEEDERELWRRHGHRLHLFDAHEIVRRDATPPGRHRQSNMTKWLTKRTEAVVGGCRMECWEVPNGRFTALVTQMLDGAVVAEMGTGQSDGLKTLKEAQAWAESCRHARTGT